MDHIDMARKGGKMRAKRLSAKRRREIASLGGWVAAQNRRKRKKRKQN